MNIEIVTEKLIWRKHFVCMVGLLQRLFFINFKSQQQKLNNTEQLTLVNERKEDK